MATQEIKIELLLGRRVFALNGRQIGRLEEVQAELRNGRCFVIEFHVGINALVERLAAWYIGRAVLHALGARRRSGYRVAWDQLDLSDPKQPRLLCEVSALKPLTD